MLSPEKMDSYKTVYAASPPELDNKVTTALAGGWRLWGEMKIESWNEELYNNSDRKAAQVRKVLYFQVLVGGPAGS